MLPPAGTSIVNDTRARRREIVRPDRRSRRDSCRTPASPRRPAAEPSAGIAWRESGPALPRPPVRPSPGCGSAAPAPVARRARPATARVTTRGLRQMTTGVALAPGATSVKRRWTFWGPASKVRRGRARRACPTRIREAMRRLDLQRLVVEGQRALVAGAAGGEIAAGKEPARPGRQVLLDLVAAGAPLRQRRLDVGGRRRQLLSSDPPSRASDIRCSACSPPSRCGRQSGR